MLSDRLSVTLVDCSQTVGWVKTPLGTAVGLGPGDIVLDEDPAPPRRRAQQPNFSAHVNCGQTAGWIRITLGTDVGLDPGDIVSDGDPAPPAKRGTTAPLFGPVYSGTVAHLSGC